MPLDDEYFTWLYSQVGEVDNKNLATRYYTLLGLLHRKEFTWSRKNRTLARDENRALDGINLRREFMREMGIDEVDPEWLNLPCSMLELMISLAFKLEWDSVDRTQAEWFWQLVKNIGLEECSDAYPPHPQIVEDILDTIIDRRYASNGAGGFFPLRHTDHDLRTVELHYQAQEYLLELEPI